MSGVDSRLIVQSMWGHSLFDFLVKKSDGKSGGIMAIWDPSKFAMSNSTIGDGFLALSGKWIPYDADCIFVVVYAPQELSRKKKLWMDIKALVDLANSISVVMGDFNEVRSVTERMGSHFCHRSASFFNEFISSSGLLDIPMGGMRFTRMNTLGSKLSKIDRILVSKQFLDRWPNSHILALTREFSDHSPLLLLNSVNDFGPIPFKFYNSWLLHEDFTNVITECWSSPIDCHSNLSAVIFKAKLKKLKLAIKLWRTTVIATETAAAMELREKIMEIDQRAEHSTLSVADITNRTDNSDHNIFIQPPSVIDINGGQRNSYIHDLTLRLALGGVSDQAPSVGDMAMETRSQNSIHQGNSSYEVGGMVSGQAPSISDMVRGNMSSGCTHSFSLDKSAPSWNSLIKRDSSLMMTESYN
ncbi:cytochrome P450 [Artemisia annua]|uniref:Cytochrome P450 n=1 Tax=Artemisia annua TaxID=35608 RepID=A0A2U1MNI8_ARTAN|nr:cytochrome P450 [Artemisia annua]